MEIKAIFFSHTKKKCCFENVCWKSVSFLEQLIEMVLRELSNTNQDFHSQENCIAVEVNWCSAMQRHRNRRRTQISESSM